MRHALTERDQSRLQTFVADERVRRSFNWATLALLFHFAVQYFWSPPLGVVVQGMVIGGLTALISFGIALIHRANRIVNFAQGDLGGAPAALMVLLIAGPGFPYFVALPIGIACAIVLGIVVEFVFIRRFFNAPRLILTVATIGLSQILAGVGLTLPRLFDFDTPPQRFPSPFDFSFEISPIIFRGNDIIAMLAVAVAIVGLVAFFRYTNIGIAVRASAESAERAFLLGIPVKRVHTTVWVIATVLSTVAMFLRAGIMGLPFGRVLAPAILLRALAAAVIGRMESLPVIFGAALALGIVEQSMVFATGRSDVTAPILFVVVLGALLLQRQIQTGRAEEGSSWQAAREVRRVPRELAKVPEVLWGGRILGALLLAALVLLPFVVSESRVNLAAAIAIYAIVGVSLVVLTGWAGQVSLGQMALVGIGAAVAGALTSKAGWELSLAIVVGGLAGALVATIIGLPALRIRGLFLAVTTLAFALATSQFLLSREFFDRWLPETRVERVPLFGRVAIDTEARFYYLSLVGLGLALASARSIRRSRTGRALIGTRENERGVQAFGVNVMRAKLTAFGVSGFLAAYAGGLFVHHQQSLNITPFEPEQSLAIFTMVVIGGLGSLPGALLGALYIRGVSWFLPPGFRFFASGIGVLLILIVIPGGLGSVLYQLRDEYLRFVARRRRIVVPSLVADARSAEVAFAQRASIDVLQFGRPDEAAEVTAALAPVVDADGAAPPDPNGRPARKPRTSAKPPAPPGPTNGRRARAARTPARRRPS